MGILSSLFGRRDSKDTAKQRLKLVLMHDRSVISPEVLEMLRRDIVAVISKYLEVDTSGIDCKLSSEDDVSALSVSVPVNGMKRGSAVMAELAGRRRG